MTWRSLSISPCKTDPSKADPILQAMHTDAKYGIS